MVFSSLTFLYIFFPAVILIYYLIPSAKHNAFKNFFILISGLLFYAWGEPFYVIMMIVSTLIDYCAGLCMNKFDRSPWIRRLCLIVSVIMNLSLLGVFKYSDFIITNINLIFGTSIPNPNLPLPIGISFFTFQSMSYTIDLYLRKIKVQKNPINFAAFVTLFPQIVAGPIVRYEDIDYELENRKSSLDMIYEGIVIFVTGLGKKVLIANNIGLLWQTVKALEISSLSVLTAWLGIIAFTFQIYFDFSGYSDMAVGLGKMMGFNFPQNFNYPYLSKSISEFWRRWHMTLGGWFRSYVYIPLGGNRKGKGRTVFNLAVVWILTGMWHGASWNFILWGAYYGLVIICERLFLGKLLEKAPAALSWLYTILLVIFGWVLFDLPDLSSAFSYFGAMFGAGGKLVDTQCLYLIQNYGIIFIIAFFASTDAWKKISEYVKERFPAFFNYSMPVCKTAVLLVSTAYLVDATYNPFLYFNF